VPVQAPQARDHHRGQDQVVGEGLRAPSPEHVLYAGQGGTAVGYGHARPHHPYPELGSLQTNLVIDVDLHQDHHQQGQEDLLPCLYLYRGEVVETESVESLEHKTSPVHCLERVVGHELAIVEPDEGHHHPHQEGHAGGLPRGLVPVEPGTHLDAHQELNDRTDRGRVPYKLFPLV